MPDQALPPVPREPNTLGKSSLVTGILGSFFVVMIGLCAGVGKEQGWLPHVGGVLLILGGSFAFLGAIAALLGFLGLFGRNRARGTAIAGLILGLFTILLFVAIVNQASQ